MLFGFQGAAEASKKCAGKKASIYSSIRGVCQGGFLHCLQNVHKNKTILYTVFDISPSSGKKETHRKTGALTV